MVQVTITYSEETFKTAIVGVTYDNPNGSSRQTIISKLKAGDSVTLCREPDNQYDKYAISVLTSNGEQMGYLPKGDSRLALHLDQGGTARAEIIAITGGKTFFQKMFGMNGQSYGCVVQIYKSQPDWKASEPWMAANREIDDVTKQAYQFEKTAPDKAITLYRKAIKLIKAMDSNGKTAIAWRSSKYPINRLSLLLDKAGQKSEALNEIEDWIEYNDPVEISDADKETVMKRRSRLSKN